MYWIWTIFGMMSLLLILSMVVLLIISALSTKPEKIKASMGLMYWTCFMLFFAAVLGSVSGALTAALHASETNLPLSEFIVEDVIRVTLIFSIYEEGCQMFGIITRLFLLKKGNSGVSASPKNHLIMRLLKRKQNENRITYISLLFGFIGEFILFIQTRKISLLWTMTVTDILLFMSFIHQYILKYRIEHGLYGTCYSEAKEIVSFILEWHRKNGDSNSKPPKLVFTQEEIDQCLEVNGGEEYAG